jgi:hypothetical protein
MLPPVGRNWQLIDPNWCLLCQRRFIELGAEPIRVCINLTLSAQWSSNQDIKEKMHCLHQPPFRAQWSCNINIKKSQKFTFYLTLHGSITQRLII